MIPKFRVWDKEGNRMILPKYLYSIDLLKEQVTERTKCNYTFSLHSIPFDKVEFMQSTGLKDKNGKEIFEGDILKSNNYITSVFYEKGAYCVKFRRTTNTTVTMNVISFIEKYKTKIIGNIYENPELLEVEG